MTIRNLSAFIASVIGFGAIAALPAAAAVTVMGTGLAQSCYRAAEFGSNPQEGIAACNLALDSQPLTVQDRASTYVNRGILRTRVDDIAGALNDYDTALRIKPDLGEGYVDRGASFIMLKRYRDALADIDKGLNLGANKPHIAYYDRAIVHEFLGDIRAAYEDYKKAVELQPDFTLAIEQLKRFKVIRKPADGV